ATRLISGVLFREVAAEGGEDLEPVLIIPIEGAPETVIVYTDASGDTEAYLIDQNDMAHLMGKVPIDQDGFKNSPTIVFSGGFYFLSSDSILNRANFDAEGVLQIETVREGVIAFDFDSRGHLAFSTDSGVYLRKDDGSLYDLDGSVGKKLFFHNDVMYGAVNAGGISYWNSNLNAWTDAYINPDTGELIWQYSAYPASAITATVYTGNRQACEIQRLQARNWLICGTQVFYFGGVNDVLSLQDLTYAAITDFDTAKRALSDNYLYYADSARNLKRVDLIQQTATTISDQYLISTLTVSRDDTLLFSGVTDLEERKFIQITPDLTETELGSTEVEQIHFLN
ncbi:MAG: PQQ-like beta-propeller repeat protein, partial [Nitrospina sp.]|nr:PQQ-like beta-propeller repeat protein [Nitrospina sp.]